jgi:heme oxygenase (biliverdin-IX-beta and delta-forming)
MAPTESNNPDIEESQGPDRRTSLRAATQHLHRDLDELVADLDLADPADYRRFLRASAAPLLGIESFLERSSVEQLLPDWPQRARSRAILSDLQAMKVSAAPYELRRATPTPAEMFGMLYVLEGSRLGARVLRERVMTSSDAMVRTANAYLSANDPRHWRTFLQTLESTDDADDGSETTSGAIYAFALFQRSFSML